MEYLLKNLQAGKRYAVQIRSISGSSVSEWSPAFTVSAETDATIPRQITTLTGTVVGSGFSLKWAKPVRNTNNTRFRDLDGYVLSISNGSFTKTREYNDPSAYYSYDDNVEDFGTPSATLTFTVAAKDRSGNVGVDSNIVILTNLAPLPVTGVATVTSYQGVTVSWVDSTEKDVSLYEVYYGTTVGFTPDTSGFSNLAYSGSSNSVLLDDLGAGTFYFKVCAVDAYNQRSTFASSSATGAGEGAATLQVAVLNEGTSLTTAVDSINFVGGGVVASNSGDAVTVKVADIQTFGYPGTLATYVGAGRYYIESACTISSIRASVGTAPTGASVIVDVNKNGTTVFTTQANRPTIAASGFTSGAVTNMNITSLAAGDYLTIDIDQVGSTIAGADLTVTVVLL